VLRETLTPYMRVSAPRSSGQDERLHAYQEGCDNLLHIRVKVQDVFGHLEQFQGNYEKIENMIRYIVARHSQPSEHTGSMDRGLT
jgi:hypothetical protein